MLTTSFERSNQGAIDFFIVENDSTFKVNFATSKYSFIKWLFSRFQLDIIVCMCIHILNEEGFQCFNFSMTHSLYVCKQMTRKVNLPPNKKEIEKVSITKK